MLQRDLYGEDNQAETIWKRYLKAMLGLPTSIPAQAFSDCPLFEGMLYSGYEDIIFLHSIFHTEKRPYLRPSGQAPNLFISHRIFIKNFS